MYGLGFRNYSIGEIDALNYISVYFTALVLTYFVWKLNLEYNKPFLIKFIFSLALTGVTIWESSMISAPLILVKVVFLLLSCFLFWHFLDKIFYQ